MAGFLSGRKYDRALLMGMALVMAGCRSGGIPGGIPASLPPRTDLTLNAWFPPVQRQQGNSCAQQAGLYYLLTAGRNRETRQSSWQPSARLSPYQTYAILAESFTGGTHVTDGWHLAKETGVPFEMDLPRGGRGLMHGFEKYVRATRNRPDSWQMLPLRTAGDLRAVMGQLAAGNPVACDFQVRGARLLKRPEGGTLVREWGRSGPGHTMVYAGYDENIGYDINRDGRLTNDQDITGDGKVTLADYERGAFLVVNPWGPRWGTGGKAWALWREHAVTSWPRAGEVAVVKPATGPGAPGHFLKISLYVKERRDLVISVGDGSRQFQPLPFRREALPFQSSSRVSSWEVFGKVHRPGPQISAGPLANPAGGPLEMGLALHGFSEHPRQLTLTTASGRGLQGTLNAASFVEVNGAGKIVRETPVTGLPTILKPAGGTWSTNR